MTPEEAAALLVVDPGDGIVRTYSVAACGDCPVGKCDDCDICQWTASLPGSEPHEAILHGFAMGHEQPPDEEDEGQ